MQDRRLFGEPTAELMVAHYFTVLGALLSTYYQQTDITQAQLVTFLQGALGGREVSQNTEEALRILSRVIELLSNEVYKPVHAGILAAILPSLSQLHIQLEQNPQLDALKLQIANLLCENIVRNDNNEPIVSLVTKNLMGTLQTGALRLPAEAVSQLIDNFAHYSRINANSQTTSIHFRTLLTLLQMAPVETFSSAQLAALNATTAGLQFNDRYAESDRISQFLPLIQARANLPADLVETILQVYRPSQAYFRAGTTNN